MEDLVGFLVGAGVIGLFVVLFFIEKNYPAKQKPKVIAALEESERLGDTDIDTDIKKVAHRWYLLREAARQPKRYNVVEYKERIDAQLKVLEPHNSKLRSHMGRGAGIDLTHIGSI